MRRLFYILIFPFLVFSIFWSVFSPVFCEALDVPQLKGRVNDYAGMISAPAEARLEEELKSFEQSDSTQIVILTIPSLAGEVIEEFGIRVADAWKIGQKEKDNGVILIASKEDREMRIEVGSGLEGRLTDLMSGRIIDLVMKPRFKRGDFDGGFMAGVSALIDASRGEFQPEEGPPAGREKGISPFFSFLIFWGIFLIALGAISRILSSIAGAIGLPALIHLTLFPLGLVAFIILAIIGMGLGFLFPLLSPAGGYPGSHRRGGVFQGGPGGGFYGTGGGGFGGGDSGGFSGGGGGFGGGGASGKW